MLVFRATRKLAKQLILKLGLGPVIEYCKRCGRKQPIVWWADNAVWKEITGSTGGVCCPECFDHLAQKKGILLRWRPEVEQPSHSLSSKELYAKLTEILTQQLGFTEHGGCSDTAEFKHHPTGLWVVLNWGECEDIPATPCENCINRAKERQAGDS